MKLSKQHTGEPQTKQGNPVKWVPSVYFGMGLPFIAISQVATLIYKDLGIPNHDITYWVSLLTLPWSLKPLLSLVMELFGTKRQYLVLTEMFTALMFGLVCFALPLPNFFHITLSLFGLMAISGSTHDIAGDGIYMQELSTKQQGIYAGWQGASYNLAKVLANGALVSLAGVLSKSIGFVHGWIVIMAVCGVVMLLLSLYHIVVLPKEQDRVRPTLKEGLANLKEIVLAFISKKYIWLYLTFIVLYRLAEGFAMKVVPLFLKDSIALGGIGLSNKNFGMIYGTAGTAAFILGSILAGYFVSHFGLKRVLSSLVLIFNIPFVVYLLLAIYQPTSLWWVSTGIIFEYFGYGFGFVGITLFMMQQIAPGKYQMAHYAFANSAMNLAVMVPGMYSGAISKALGYQDFFTMVMLTTIPVIILVFFIPFTYEDKATNE